MANLLKSIRENLFDSVLPTFGSPKVHVPIWDNGQRMFICDEYESASGNRYLRGFRFSNRIVIVEKVGLFHNWTYIDGLELYAFNGKKMVLVQKRDYDKEFRSGDFVKRESESMVKDYLSGILRMQGGTIDEDELNSKTKELVEECYKSILDSDYNIRLTEILPAIEQK